MSDRLCGYCRQPGHVSSKCGVRLGQIETIKQHVGEQRKLAQKILLANGVGVGSIVTATDYWTGNEVPCLVPSLKMVEGYVDWKCIKYKKQVRALLGTYGVEMPESKFDGLVRYAPRTRISIPVYKMEDMSCTMTAYFFLDKLQNPLVCVGNARVWDYNKHSEILSPSEDSDVTDKDLLEPFHLHERLTLKRSGSNLVAPIL